MVPPAWPTVGQGEEFADPPSTPGHAVSEDNSRSRAPRTLAAPAARAYDGLAAAAPGCRGVLSPSASHGENLDAPSPPLARIDLSL